MNERYVVVRAAQAGCFAGVLVSRKGDEVELRQARRLWYWSGAASLSELATHGTNQPKDCKFTVPVERHEILGVIEVLDATAEARANIEAVPEWRA